MGSTGNLPGVFKVFQSTPRKDAERNVWSARGPELVSRLLCQVSHRYAWSQAVRWQEGEEGNISLLIFYLKEIYKLSRAKYSQAHAQYFTFERGAI